MGAALIGVDGPGCESCDNWPREEVRLPLAVLG